MRQISLPMVPFTRRLRAPVTSTGTDITVISPKADPFWSNVLAGLMLFIFLCAIARYYWPISSLPKRKNLTKRQKNRLLKRLDEYR